jgi:hypothetical protein
MKSPKYSAQSCDFNQSYRRVLSTAQSSRSRKVSDVTWRSHMNASPAKLQPNEEGVDLGTASVTQYLQWHRHHTKAGLRLSERRSSEQQEKGRNTPNVSA